MTDANKNPAPQLPVTDAPPELTPPPVKDWGAAILERFGEEGDQSGISDGDGGGAWVDALAQIKREDKAAVTEPEPEKAATEPAAGSREAGDEAQEPSPAADITTPEPAPEPVSEGGWDYSYVDPSTNQPASMHFTDDQVHRGLLLANWADSLPDDLRQAFGEIESGQSVPIRRADYDIYLAWQHAQTIKSRDSDLDNLDADPEVLKLLKSQRDQIEQLSQQQPQYQPATGVNTVANLTAQAQQMDAAKEEYARARHLDANEIARLWSDTVNSGIISYIARDRAQVNPVTGQLIAPANPAQVVYEALDYHLTRNPPLHAAVVDRHTRASNPSPAPAENTQPTSPASQPTQPAAEYSDDAIRAKKAQAASLASAPSASANPAPRPIHNLTGSDLVDAMAADIARMQNGDNS